MLRAVLAITSLILNVLFAFDAVNAVNVRPPECRDLPGGCTCTTDNRTGPDGNSTYVIAVVCKDIGLTEAPDFSGHPKLETINLKGNKIKKIRRKHFANLTELSHLDLSYNMIDEIESYSFNSSTALQKILLEYNQLSTLPLSFLNPEITLNVLQLSNNKFTKMPSDSLHNHPKIKTLYLSHNPIGSLQSFAFARNGTHSSLEDLFLVGCNIVDIMADAFNGLRELQSLDLDHNQLRRISRSMLKRLPESLRTFSARHNEIETIDSDAFYDVKRVLAIYLDHNKIDRLQAGTCKKLALLKVLSLEYNNISDIDKKAFRGCDFLESLYLSWNRIDALHPETFRGLKGLNNYSVLIEIYLTGNRLVTINPKVFNPKYLPYLQVLDLGYNEILEIPRIQSESLTYYHLEVNNLTYADYNAFAGVPNVEILKLAYNDIILHNDTLKPLKFLREILIQGNHLLTHLPSLKNNLYLQSMDIEHCSLEELPEDLCITCPRLHLLSAFGNYLKRIPKLGNCTGLDGLSLSHNEIESLDNLPFEGLYFLQILEINNNKITSLPADVFKDLTFLVDLFMEHNSIGYLPVNLFRAGHHMEFLNISYNPIWELQDGVLHDLYLVNELYLKNMGLRRISDNAFPEDMSHLLLLDLSDNDFDHLPIPRSGWPELRYLYLYGVPSLYRAPGPADCPKLQGAVFTYAYHCCAFESFLPPGWHEPDDIYEPPTTQLPSDIADTEEVVPPSEWTSGDYDKVCDDWKAIFPGHPCPHERPTNVSHEPPKLNITEIEIIRRLDVASIPPDKSFVCYPKADPMSPCEDLLGSWVLRVLIWVVFVVTLFGNGLVLTIILASPKPARRLGPPIVDRKVSQFYISQLAVADIGIGIYLGFLAVVDLKTFGKQEFYQMALSWQYGPGCLTAGFIAILSSELSVYILVIITLERIYVYKHAMLVNKMHMCNAIFIMLFGWLFAATCATLPLVGYNRYTVVAICLPFDVVTTNGRFYIAVLMGINLLAFLIVAACNFYLYCRLRRISSVTTSDSKMFRMVFVLVITDFICWAPLVTLSLAALFRHDLINTSIAKWFAVLVLPINACVNPFLYGLLTEKFKHQMKGMCHRAKRLLPGHCASGIQPVQQHSRRNSTSQGEIHRPSCSCSIGLPYMHSLEQNSPGSLSSGSISSSNAPFFGRRASLPALGSEGLRIGSPRGMIRFLPAPLNDSMPELTASNETTGPSFYPFFPHVPLEKPMGKTKSTLATVKEQVTEPIITQSESSNNVGIMEVNDRKNFDGATVLDKISPRVHHSSDERSGTDSLSLGIGSSVQGTDEDSHSITSLYLETANASNSNHDPMICVYEETDV